MNTSKDIHIPIYHRNRKVVEYECVFERGFMDFIYGTSLGRFFEKVLFSQRIFSQIYRYPQDSIRYGSRKISQFIQRYNIDVSVVEKEINEYITFNDFFTRRLKLNARPIDDHPDHFISPVDGRLLVYPMNEGQIFPVKGRPFSLRTFLGDTPLAERYIGGICLVFRLAPMDYHRVHYVDKGRTSKVHRLGGRLHSVSPLSIRQGLPVFIENKRDICTLQSETFGLLVHADVGAMVVGDIQQVNPCETKVERGDEKSVFHFGGSTVVIIVEPNKLVMDKDICHYSTQGIETFVHMGARIGVSE